MGRWKRVIFFLFLGCSVAFGSEECFVAGQHYQVLPQPATLQPEVTLFFSFFCEECRVLSHCCMLCARLKQTLPPHGRFRACCVSISRYDQVSLPAWGLALLLGVEERVQEKLFALFQESRVLPSFTQVGELFMAAGVLDSAYHNAEKSLFLKTLIQMQEKASERHQVQAVPSVVVNGHYRIDMDGFSGYTHEQFAQACCACVEFLLKKDGMAWCPQ